MVAALVLTGEHYFAKITPSNDQLKGLREIHGQDLEKWWRDYFGHTFDRLTQSEARYLSRSPNADQIRERINEAKCPRDLQGHSGSAKTKRQRLKQLEVELKRRFPNGAPHSQRPTVGQWQGYDEPKRVDATELSSNYFSSNRSITPVRFPAASLPPVSKGRRV